MTILWSREYHVANTPGDCRIRWIRLIVGAFAAEIAAILVLVALVAVFGPREASAAQAYAEKLGRWVGPLAGMLFAFVGAFVIVRPLSGEHLQHGVLFGLLLGLLDVAILFAMRAPFEWVFVISNIGKFLAALLAGPAPADIFRPLHNAIQEEDRLTRICPPGSHPGPTAISQGR